MYGKEKTNQKTVAQKAQGGEEGKEEKSIGTIGSSGTTPSAPTRSGRVTMEGGNPIVLMHDQRKTIRVMFFVLLFTLFIAGVAFVRSFLLDVDAIEQMKLSHQERLKIAQQNRAEYVEDRRKHDSIRTLEGRIREAQILELKQKGFWRE